MHRKENDGERQLFMEKDIYREQEIDMVKLALCLKKKIWIPVLALFAGAVLAAGVYAVQYRLANGPVYQAVSKVYLDFACDETGEVYQYYNGYTWNDLMRTDPIMEKTMEALPGMDRSEVEEATKAEILSDIRLLTITITHTDAAVCGQIQEASEKSLEALGSSAKEFLDITVVKSDKPERIMADVRIRQAVLLGAVLFFAASFMWILIGLVLDDTIFVPSDILGSLQVPFLGIETMGDGSGEKAERYRKFVSRLQSDLQSNKEYLGAAPDQAVSLDAGEWIAGEIPVVDYDALREASYVILRVKFGGVSLRALHYLLQQLALQNCARVGVVITEADTEWMYHYFRWGSEK